MLNEDEIDRLARANFERRIGAIVVEHQQTQQRRNGKCQKERLLEGMQLSLLRQTAEKKKKKKKKKKTTKEEEDEEDVRETSRKEVAKGLEPSETTTTKEEEEEEEDANEKARKEVAKGLEQSAKAFKHASEIILMAGGEGAKARRWAKDTSTSSPLRVDVDDDDAGEEKENTKTTREERRAVERKMEEIAKRVYVENETKTRARERLAVVDTILEVLKDTGGDGKGGGDA